MDLLGEQLPNVAGETRRGLMKTINSIAELIRKLLVAKSDSATVVACFHAVDAIASTMCPGEESALTLIVPVALGYVRDGRCVPEALTALHSSMYVRIILDDTRHTNDFVCRVKLGPRVIPYFKDAVSVCVGVLRHADSTETASENDDALPASSALGILQALLSSIPRFWSNSELSQVIDLYLDNQSSELGNFMKAISKKAQSKILLPLLADMWSPLSTSRNKVRR